MQRITPCLWFNNNAEEAVKLYTSLFENSKILKTVRYTEAMSKESGQPAGSVMTIEYELNGNKFLALNGGTHFKLTGAVSFMVPCKNQEEIDKFWNAFAEGGEEMPCGWITDRFGLTWQIIPEELDKMLSDKDPKKAKGAAEAMFKMKKLIIADLKKGYEGN